MSQGKTISLHDSDNEDADDVMQVMRADSARSPPVRSPLNTRNVLSFDMGTRNLAFALVQPPCTILRMGIIDLGKHAARQATDTLVDSLLEENAWMSDGDHEVVVELQPGSGVCKTLSHVLQAFFRTYDRLHQVVEGRYFRFMPAGNKLRFDASVFAQFSPQTYADRKACAVAMARNILAQQVDEKYSRFFEAQGYKQKTDVADALVQACRHIQDR